MTPRTVLVTGALGLVGSAVIDELVAEGCRVVATDLETPSNRKKARRLQRSRRIEIRWADLTEVGAADALVTSVTPGAIVHLAAVIPPLCYARRSLARAVNVDATVSLVRAASSASPPPRFVLASSVAVYGPRNPHRRSDLLTATTPVGPCDLYGAHKVEAERAVTTSGLDWVILRLGGVMTPAPRPEAGLDMVYFEGLLPTDGRLQTVDVRDVARAFARSTSTDATNEVFLVGGDASHRVVQGAVGSAMAGALGLSGVLPSGRPGDPDSDRDWFSTDWMDTGRAQEVLSFQGHSLPDLFDEAGSKVGWLRWPLRAVSPIARGYLRARSPYRHQAGQFADPWGAIRRKWGDPSPEEPAPDGPRAL